MHDFSIDRSWLDAVVREAVKQALETVMELEREVFLAEWGGKKNGYYERGLVTKHGPVRLREHLQDALHPQGRYPRGNLLQLPSLLYGPPEAD